MLLDAPHCFNFTYNQAEFMHPSRENIVKKIYYAQFLLILMENPNHVGNLILDKLCWELKENQRDENYSFSVTSLLSTRK